MVGGAGEHSGASFIRALIPFMRAAPSWFKHLPKAPPTNTVIFGSWESNVNSGVGEGTNLQILALMICVTVVQKSVCTVIGQPQVTAPQKCVPFLPILDFYPVPLLQPIEFMPRGDPEV